MASPELASRLEDILDAVATIGIYTSGKSEADYEADRNAP
jgi:hypothetical protein